VNTTYTTARDMTGEVEPALLGIGERDVPSSLCR